MSKAQLLKGIRDRLDESEGERLSPYACLSRNAIRKNEEEKVRMGHRQSFSLDTDRILHSLAYSRYIDKTQVFYLIRNDHITHRVLHVQLVSKIARTIGRLLRLNEDLIEAIALGHDIGHAPFGHDGERFLSELSLDYGLGHFLHNIQGVRFLQKIERKGKGWNLTLQVLDGILCHDGELHRQALYPENNKDFKALEQEIREKQENPQKDLSPMTLEGCVVRMADTISYVGRDIEDAIRLRVISRSDIPQDCRRVLGDTNGTIVYTLVEDLVSNSLDKPFVCFGKQVGDALRKLKAFNQEKIYVSEKIKKQTPKIKLMFRLLFQKYIHDLESGNESSDIHREFLEGMSEAYKAETPPAEIVRDFIAGMTDEYFLAQCQKHLFPQMSPSPL
ncbi:MAG: HD domain-containing protein [Deltaproteobacteria bacterium]|nr:HD domain-containing protein [Deltaproteobacteria bacterium]MBW1935434.1 HD domain-containing protein [Deltaproteobacteria bacterium]MBW1977492.1 HD domain-containing protein [Deltaproteobacteria bacterium]MBW2299703.1 HD domain-containing protein [Deltaproteobacteria bacterium]RLB34180.1 MAG: phosphohydrolase [Deltaproteobacteria bacterium]